MEPSRAAGRVRKGTAAEFSCIFMPEMPDFERVDPLASRAAGWKAAALAMHAASST